MSGSDSNMTLLIGKKSIKGSHNCYAYFLDDQERLDKNVMKFKQ